MMTYEDNVQYLYEEERLSIQNIAERLETNFYRVWSVLEKRDIERRPEGGVMKPPNLRHLSTEEIAYLAGIVDGEGSIIIRNNKWQTVFLVVGNTSLALIDWLGDICGATYEVGKKNGGLSKKPIDTWRCLRTSNIVELLRAMLPYLKIKKEQAEKAIQICESKLRRYGL